MEAPRLRSIKNCLIEIKANDEQSPVNEKQIRHLLKEGKVKHIKSGKNIFVNYDHLLEVLSGETIAPVAKEEEISGYGKLRKII